MKKHLALIEIGLPREWGCMGMVKITDEMKEFIKEQKISYVATANKKGLPNISPKGPLRVVDDKTLAFADLFSKKTRNNLKDNPWIAVSVVNVERKEGFQFRGKAEVLTQGPLYVQITNDISKPYTMRPVVQSVVKIRVKEIHDLAPPGEYYLE
jgi:predicted pyridoxine 5'-phosphate oxidase superfamily flavin-nucleotide-binding protein